MSRRSVPSPPNAPRPPRSRRRLRRGDQSGAAILEFALVIPIFLFVLYGLITFGLILAQKQQITNAAADGARAAVGQSDPVAAATARVEESLGAPGDYTATYSTGVCTGGPGQCITVDIVYDYANHPIVPPAPGLGLVTPDTFHSSAVVQYT